MKKKAMMVLGIFFVVAGLFYLVPQFAISVFGYVGSSLVFIGIGAYLIYRSKK